MKLTKSWWKIVISVLGLIILLIMPISYDMYYRPFYYALCGLLCLVLIFRIKYEKQLEERFYKYWAKARKQGFWINFLKGGTGSLVFMAVIVCIGQIFANGITALERISRLSGGALALIFFILLFFSLLAAVVRWHENEKRYYQIYYRNQYRG